MCRNDNDQSLVAWAFVNQQWHLTAFTGNLDVVYKV